MIILFSLEVRVFSDWSVMNVRVGVVRVKINENFCHYSSFYIQVELKYFTSIIVLACVQIPCPRRMVQKMWNQKVS